MRAVSNCLTCDFRLHPVSRIKSQALLLPLKGGVYSPLQPLSRRDADQSSVGLIQAAARPVVTRVDETGFDILTVVGAGDTGYRVAVVRTLVGQTKQSGRSYRALADWS